MQIFEETFAQGLLTSGTGHEQFEHHVVGQDNVGRSLLHFCAGLVVFLTCIFAKSKRTGASGLLLKCRLVARQLFCLRVDECIHWVNDDGNCFVLACSLMLKDIIEYSGHKRARFSGTSTGSDDEFTVLASQLDSLLLMLVKRSGKEFLQVGMDGEALRNHFFHTSAFGKVRVELDEGLWPQFLRTDRLADLLLDAVVLYSYKALKVAFVATFQLLV